MKICFSDNQKHLEFAPLSILKPIAKLRMGLLTFEERWLKFLNGEVSGYETEAYLSNKFPRGNGEGLVISSNVIPNPELVNAIGKMDSGKLISDGVCIARKGGSGTEINYEGQLILINKRWELFTKNEELTRSDFELITKDRNSELLSSTVTVIGDPNLVFLEKGARAEACVLNTKDGPIYLDEDSEIMEGSLVRGPFGLGKHSTLKMAAKIYGGCSFGEHCKIGGEVSNSVFQGYSNKGHDGFVGNSLIGEWCNLGADTNTSNLKNNYSPVRSYSYVEQSEVETGEMFMGLTMGDHSKSGINTMFNTATVVGVSCNLYGGDFPAKYIPSFSWGGAELVKFRLAKAIEASNNMMKRRGKELSESDIEIFKYLSEKAS